MDTDIKRKALAAEIVDTIRPGLLLGIDKNAVKDDDHARYRVEILTRSRERAIETTVGILRAADF